MQIVNCRLALMFFISMLPLLTLRYALHIIFTALHIDRSVIIEESNIQADDHLVFNSIKSPTLKTYMRFLWNLHYNPYFLAAFYCRIRPTRAWLCSFFRRSYYPFFLKPQNVGILHYHHPFSSIINARHVGNHVTIRQNTTIGNKGTVGEDEKPYIGDNVDIGANSIIFGKITIGDNVHIGAGTLINKDVPSNAIVVGNPFRIIGYTINNPN